MNIKHIIFFTFVVATLCSCEDFFNSPVDTTVDEKESKLVIFGYLNENEEIQEITVSSSSGFQKKSKGKSVENATLKLYKNDREIASIGDDYYQENNTKDWYYKTPLAAGNGDIFKVEVSAPELPSASASVSVPPTLEVKEVKHSGKKYNTEWDETYEEIEVTIQDNPNEANYYAVSMYWLDPILSNPIYSDNGEIIGYRDTTIQRVPLYIYNGNDPNASEWSSNFVLLSDETFNGKYYDIKVHHNDYYSDGEKELYEVVVSSISKDLYDFAITYNQVYFADGNPFSEPVTVHSNIENGLGMFAIFRDHISKLEF